MKITLEDWNELDQTARKACELLQQLSRRLTELRLKYRPQSAEGLLLARLDGRALEAITALAPSLYHLQDEWTGGDSADPRNHTLREPNWVGHPHSFPPEAVNCYRDAQGVIHLPQHFDRERGILEEIRGRWRPIRQEAENEEVAPLGLLVDRGFVDWLDDLLAGLEGEDVSG